ncbi:MAG TPA: alpha/beta fold hydrolase [Candidatus Pacearchaeota archaeon]|nr:alpha/beta fold hydrolase [Candidatus Pacearchaeota archaeon]
MKNVFLIHGWGGSSSSEPWFNWLKEELTSRKFKVTSFDMPNTDHPKIEEWIGYLRENIPLEEISEETYFVGHSIGCQTILRYLEKLPKHKRIGGCVFIAPWLDLINLEPEEIKIAHPWINEKIDFGRILDHTNNFLCIFSEDDPDVHLDESKKFKENLGAKIIIKKHEEHFNETKKIPEILNHIK